MKVTVCQLPDDPHDFQRAWEELRAHVRREQSQLVLLPEMPFSSWLAASPHPRQAAWEQSVRSHERWCERLVELSPAAVLGSRPVIRDGRRLNEGFIWEAQEGDRIAHTKYYLPNDEYFWEATWYSRGDGRFQAADCGPARLGFVICTDLWFFERARAYGRQGIHLLVNPRATLAETTEKWLAGGRAAAVVSGAFCLSANKASPPGSTPHFGGRGWVTGPDGDVLALTSEAEPFVTLDIDLRLAEQAKQTYPRYVLE